MTTCHICSSSAPLFGRGRLLNRYDVQYYACETCEFIQTEDPYWLPEAYREPIGGSDIGLIGRNISLARTASLVISCFFRAGSKFLDFGGGTGMFVRLMRDTGYDFYWYDSHASNAFARGFEARQGDQFELVTAFEVFEHLPRPLEEIERMFGFSKSVLFTTQVVPRNRPKPGEWWYYALEGGQHVSLYSRKSLGEIARRFAVNLYSAGSSLHLLTPRRLWPWMFRLVTRPRYQAMLRACFRRRSLLEDDYLRVTGTRLC